MPNEVVTHRGHRYRVEEGKPPDDGFRWRAMSAGWGSTGSNLDPEWQAFGECLPDTKRTSLTQEEANRSAENAIARHILQDDCSVNP